MREETQSVFIHDEVKFIEKFGDVISVPNKYEMENKYSIATELEAS